ALVELNLTVIRSLGLASPQMRTFISCCKTMLSPMIAGTCTLASTLIELTRINSSSFASVSVGLSVICYLESILNHQLLFGGESDGVVTCFSRKGSERNADAEKYLAHASASWFSLLTKKPGRK